MEQTATTPGSIASLPSREFGLALQLIFGRYLINMQDLHYGYWPDGLSVEPANFTEAQAAYTEFVISQIPIGAQSILDVGCGAGNTALKLVNRGYRVDCVSPNGYLTGVAKQRLGTKVGFFETRMEELETDRRYDLILFSESLLFMSLEAALRKALSLLNAGGHILVIDIFKLPAEGRSPIGGGQRLSVFQEAIASLPLETIKNIDITARIAPTFDLLDRAYAEMIKPAYDLIMARLTVHYPWLMKLLRWKFRRGFEKYEGKHFSGQRNGKNFMKFKSYRLFLFRQRNHLQVRPGAREK